MAWFDKALKSVQGTAEKAAFEGEKLVRVNREESALSEMLRKSQARMVDLGEATLGLYRSGALADPGVAALAAEVAGLEEQVRLQREKIEAIHREQFQAEPAAAPVVAPAVAEAPVVMAPVAAAPVAAPVAEEIVAPEPVAAPDTVECPNCHAQVKATIKFCTECGGRIQ